MENDPLRDGPVNVDRTVTSIDQLTELVIQTAQLGAETSEKFDKLIDKIDARNNNTQKIELTTAGPGPLLASAITACFCSMFMIILIAMWVGFIYDDVRDLKAWQQIHEKRINALEHPKAATGEAK